ncbi:MAG: nickel pincer cofactor biosynthesis protein LarC [Planctomycetia bacterium]|nr:nickel pincer cofactor biosynthesis protein LarC [Planctomycetia bacterium]
MSNPMKILRWDSVGGASGDMILNALLSLCQKVGIPQEAVETPLHELIPEPFSLRWETESSHGMSGNVLRVEIPHSHEEHHHHHHHEHHHHHRTFADIRKMIEASSLPPRVRELSIAVFSILAEAEGKVHGMPAEKVHFHEVGATDSLVDMVGACLAYDLLGVEGISLSPLPVGSGLVHCAHGTYPLPAPATALLVETHQLPVSLDNEEGEMLTPTAAALFSVWPRVEISTAVRVSASVNAFGHRKMLSRPNLLRATLYEPMVSRQAEETETLYQLECNLDDVSGEQLSTAMTALFAAGARDVWFSPLTMKKQRPGILLGVLTDSEHRQKMVETLFRHSGTFGVREIPVLRHSLERRWEEVTTRWGKVRIKIGAWQGEDIRFTPEFEDCQKIALEEKLPWENVAREAMQAFFSR